MGKTIEAKKYVNVTMSYVLAYGSYLTETFDDVHQLQSYL